MPEGSKIVRARGTAPARFVPGRMVTLRRVATVLASSFLVAGCVIGPGGRLLTQDQVEERTAMYPVPASQAWISAPDTQLVLQRDLGLGSEQRISLRNRTLVAGDNLIVLRTRSGATAGRILRFEELMRRVGGSPHPFEDLSSGELVTANDEFGSYFWAEERFGDSTICVLGIRRIDTSMRQVPGGEDVMDVMLRNCVVGTAEDALTPILAGSIGFPSVTQSGVDGSRLMSPLAGPTIP